MAALDRTRLIGRLPPLYMRQVYAPRCPRPSRSDDIAAIARSSVSRGCGFFAKKPRCGLRSSPRSESAFRKLDIQVGEDGRRGTPPESRYPLSMRAFVLRLASAPRRRLRERRPCPHRAGAACITRSASLEKGRLCRKTVPCPLSVAKNKPSPPKTIDFKLPTGSMS